MTIQIAAINTNSSMNAPQCNTPTRKLQNGARALNNPSFGADSEKPWFFRELDKIENRVVNLFSSDMTIKGERAVNCYKWVGKNITSPQNRLIMGLTALATQPWIDLYNKDVDKQTRKVSCARTAAKIIAGTITGVAVRYGTIGLIKQMAKVSVNGETLKSIQKIFTPSAVDVNKLKNEATKLVEQDRLNQYCNTVGTLLGLVVMLYTNFAWDIPLTKYFTKVFSNKMGIDPDANSQIAKGGQK